MTHYQFSFPSINVSAQVGDLMFYIPNPSLDYGGFDYSQSPFLLVGTILEVGVNYVIVAYDDGINTNSLPVNGDYIMFAKDPSVNDSYLLGYYAQATFKNNSAEEIELFAVGSEISESSK